MKFEFEDPCFHAFSWLCFDSKPLFTVVRCSLLLKDPQFHRLFVKVLLKTTLFKLATSFDFLQSNPQTHL